MILRLVSLALIAVISFSSAAEDNRIYVELPGMMQQHMMANMRDHLLALQTITQQLANQQYEEAADTAEQRLGMSSLESHGASHMGRFMPQEMGAIGTGMHRAASRFALKAQEESDTPAMYRALGEVTAACVACHAAYRIH